MKLTKTQMVVMSVNFVAEAIIFVVVAAMFIIYVKEHSAMIIELPTFFSIAFIATPLAGIWFLLRPGGWRIIRCTK